MIKYDLNTLTNKFALLCALCIPFFFACTDNGNTNIDKGIKYTIETDGNKNLIKVTARFTGNNADSTELRLPNNLGDASKLYENFTDFTPITKDVEIVDGDSPKIKIIKHRPNQVIEFSFILKCAANTNDTMYGPSLSPRYMHLPGEASFIVPKDWPTNVETSIEIKWVVAKQWKISNVFGDTKDQSFVATIAKLNDAVFIGGVLNLTKVTTNNGDTLNFALFGDLPNDEIKEFLTRMVKHYRLFWDDKTPSKNLTFSIHESEKTQSKTTKRGQKSVPILHREGNAHYNAFTARIPSPRDPNDPTKPFKLDAEDKRLLAHELFHLWLGRTIKDTSKDTMRWFIEGFTDYYALSLLYRFDEITAEQYAKMYGEIYFKYYSKDRESKSMPNQTLVDNYYKEADLLFYIPYGRGLAVATNIDTKIRASYPAKSLDDVMRLMFKQAVEDNVPLSTGQFIKAVEQVASDVGSYAQVKVAKNIEGGKLIKPVFGKVVDPKKESITQSVFERIFPSRKGKKIARDKSIFKVEGKEIEIQISSEFKD